MNRSKSRTYNSVGSITVSFSYELLESCCHSTRHKTQDDRQFPTSNDTQEEFGESDDASSSRILKQSKQIEMRIRTTPLLSHKVNQSTTKKTDCKILVEIPPTIVFLTSLTFIYSSTKEWQYFALPNRCHQETGRWIITNWLAFLQKIDHLASA